MQGAAGPGAGVPPRPPRAATWSVAAAISLAAVILPFTVAWLPPIADLPQQLAQIRLLHFAIAHPAGPLAVGWFDPNRLSYLVLQVAWWMGGPSGAGRVTMILFGGLWVAACFWIARRHRRTAEAAVLASLLFFNQVTYWGFFGFLLGWPCFALWLELCRRESPEGWRRRWLSALGLLGVGFLLFESHVLWWAVACAWLVIDSALSRRPPREWIDRGLSQAPLALWALLWFPTLAREGFGSQTVWGTGFLGRLSFGWLTNAFFGGLKGLAEPVALALLATWIIAALIQHRAELSMAVDHDLLLASLLLGLLVLILPQKHTNTIEFASRWAPFSLALLLLSLPPPKLRSGLRILVTLTLLLGLSGITATTWLRFDRTEMSGFEEAMRSLPERPHLLGLDFVRESKLVKGFPFLQMFAYAQVLHGGGLNFSFADFATSLVRFEPPRAIPWTSGLEWFPTSVKPRDLAYFDYVLVCGEPEVQGVFARRSQLQPVTDHGWWRLYRVTDAARELN